MRPALLGGPPSAEPLAGIRPADTGCGRRSGPAVRAGAPAARRAAQRARWLCNVLCSCRPSDSTAPFLQTINITNTNLRQDSPNSRGQEQLMSARRALPEPPRLTCDPCAHRGESARVAALREVRQSAQLGACRTLPAPQRCADALWGAGPRGRPRTRLPTTCSQRTCPTWAACRSRPTLPACRASSRSS